MSPEIIVAIIVSSASLGGSIFLYLKGAKKDEVDALRGIIQELKDYVSDLECDREKPSECNSRDNGDVLPGERVGPIIGIEGGATGAWAKLAQNKYVCVADRFGTTYLVEP
jgi:hypothetical protein